MTLFPYPEHVAKAEGFAPHPQNDTYAGAFTIKSWEEEVTLNTGGVESPTVNTVPANAVILAVLATVSTTITTATEWCVGITGALTVFGAKNTTMTAGEKSDAVAGMVGYPLLTERPICIGASGNPGAGKVRVTCIYAVLTHPSAS